MKVLVTGATGFVGSHLMELLMGEDVNEIWGVKRDRSDITNVRHILDDINWVNMELTDAVSVYRTIEKIQPDRIFHLGAIAYVPSSWEYPDRVIQVNTLGTLNILEAVRQHVPDCIVHVAGCYCEKTRALTPNGFKTYDNISVGDEVLSINPKTSEVEWKKVKNVYIYPYDGKMYHFNGRSLDLLVTPNHKLLVRKGKKTSFIEAQKLTGRTYLPTGLHTGTQSPHPLSLYYLVGLFVGDGYIVDSCRERMVSAHNREQFLENCRDENGKFINSGEKTKTKSYASERLLFAIPEGDKARERCIHELKTLGISYSEYPNEIYIHAENKELYTLLRACGKYAKNKRIPQEFMTGDISQLTALFEGLIDSDGCYRQNSYGFSTISSGLVADITALSHMLGKWMTFSKREKVVEFKKEKRVIASTGYECSITDADNRLLTAKSGDYDVVPYQGFVWCVEVEDNHNLLVERNGKTTFCGNSSEEYGRVYQDELPIKETNQLRPISPYGVSKVAADKLACQYHESYGLKTVVTRGFNHSGPRRGRIYVLPTIVRQALEIKYFGRESFSLGDLQSRRDFTDVRDMVRAYYMTDQCSFGEAYNVCSQEMYSIVEIVNKVVKLLDIENPKVVTDPERIRPSDVSVLLGDSTKFREKTGWKPEIPFDDTLNDIITYWKQQLNIMDG